MGARFLLLTAFVAAASSPAAAGSPYAPPVATTPGQTYAACIAAKDRMGSARLVLAEPGTDEENGAFAALARAQGACSKRVLRGAAEPSRTMLRGLVAEQLWLANVWRLTGRGALDANRIDVDKGFDTVPTLQDTYRLAACVAVIEPEAIDELLRTTPSSATEHAAFEALQQPVSRCLLHGRSVALDRPLLRALLAEQLYRRFPPPGSSRRRAP
jgi:hypothetical protein